MKNNAKLEEIKKYLVENGETLAVAESVTAGFLQIQFSSIADAANFFQGGITTYNIGQKCRLLNIDPIHALPLNCVSEKVALSMALNVIKLFNSDYGIGITGYAQKDKKMNITEIYAFFAVAYHNHILLTERITSKKKDSEQVKADYASQIRMAFHSLLQSTEKWLPK